ncbi:XyeB family radical SAM/SPASM peptide maturase [Xenorhabdus nematophila]|uniref:Radical SAM n=1 Tax=Xenorhabdus nematophila (strain ATCC 19061 / DSM 3370 / CCUG 14189 / LMG 1036 / NCIMB 9965 / AN6) TaxID=406817 RepID=D3VF67_XENNA|nr:cyclophane-forming radical SAM/SPASM peptide maturase XyeB [Xenorhabdus nematophila]CEE90986.1 putative Radical SAM [Xenorhabdus nematophila str. Anatoliense]CEF29155.1 putative Radical SAM [Xenorhabdus nematophila str. Websteri]AYA41838.1 XyeB family radical SAM/SPASM peptide maturase [Xenorhabdus nematophila]KHD29682.1 radical SAM protein [Xenorhabdus nematophila]MBA0020568.1 XyeB family radical SAM/SPASM peptide maturase [Xenorhabdus nematophila]
MTTSKSEKIKHLEIILKISERCNINCSYCYVFNMGNSLATDSPPVISLDNVLALRGFFERSAAENEIEVIQVDFHGGEPLMMKKDRFDQMCDILRQGDYSGSRLELALQTNGILIDDEWISLFEKHKVHASISIDGPKHINDRYRLDRKGKSTYEGTIHGLRMLQNAWKQGRLPGEPGILSVANPTANGAEIYHHFANVLKCQHFDFLIPDAHHDDDIDGIGIGRFMNEALDAWFADGRSEIFVRIFNTYLGTMLSNQFYRVIGMSANVESAYAFTVTADGLLRIDDTLRSTSDEIFNAIGHLSELSLSGVLNSPNVKEYLSLNSELPSDCADCVWNKICHGGRLVNRFSRANRFNNKTVFCSSMRLFLSRAASHLITAGIDEETIMKNIQK